MKNFSPEQSAFLQKVIDVAQNYYCIVDKSGAFVEMSDNWINLLGIPKEQILGRQFTDFVHPEDQERSIACFVEVKDGELLNSFKNRFKSSSGEFRWIVWRSAINAKTGMVYSVGNDITAEVKSEELLKLTQEVAAIGSWEYDLISNTLSWSETTYKIHELDSSCPITLDEAINFYAPDCRNEIRSSVQNAINKSEPWDTELKIITTKGEEKWVRACGWPERENSRTLKLKGVFHDIDSFKVRELENLRISRKLENINSDLEQFNYVASHDLKSPLRAISNLASWIEEDEDNILSEESKDHLQLIKKRIFRMENLLGGLLEYSQVGAYGLEASEIELESFFTDIVTMVKSDDKVEVQTDLKVKRVFTRRVPLEIVMRNIVSNAIKHCGQEVCTIKFGVRNGVNNIILTLEDNGPGVSEKYYESVFEIFKTLKSKDSNKSSESSGLGLAIVQKILKDVGGDVSLDVSSLGGLKVTVFWPRE